MAGDRRRRGPPVAGPAPAGPQMAERRADRGRLARACTGRPGWWPAAPCGPGPATPWSACPGAPPGGGLPPGEYVDAPPARRRTGRRRWRPGWIGCGPWWSVPVWARGGRRRRRRSAVARLLAASSPVPAVVDADGLRALGDLDTVRRRRQGLAAAPTVLTPHEGEYARLVGRPPGEDRIADVRAVAARTGAVVLLKGSPDRGRRARRPGPAGQRRVGPAGHRRHGRRALRASSAPSWPEACPPWRPRPWPPTPTGGPPRSGRAEGLVASRPAGPGVRLAVGGRGR